METATYQDSSVKLVGNYHDARHFFMARLVLHDLSRMVSTVSLTNRTEKKMTRGQKTSSVSQVCPNSTGCETWCLLVQPLENFISEVAGKGCCNGCKFSILETFGQQGSQTVWVWLCDFCHPQTFTVSAHERHMRLSRVLAETTL